MHDPALFELVAEQVPGGIIIADAQGRIRYLNPRAAVLLGRDRAATVGLSLREACPGAPDLLGSRAPINLPDHLIHPATGAPRRASLLVSPLVQGGVRVGTLVLLRDPEKSAAALQESEEKYRALAEHSQDTIMRFDRAGRHLYVNPVVEVQTGLPCAAFLGKTHAELGFPPHLVTLWEEAIQHVFRTGAIHRIEFELPTGVWIDWLLAPELAPDGSVRTVTTAARDITERQHAEAALRASEQRYRMIFDHSPLGIVNLDVQVRVIECNARFREMLGLGTGDLEGRSLRDILADPALRGALEETLVSGRGLAEGEYQAAPNRPRRVIKLTASRIAGPEGGLAGLVAVCEDVTEQRRAERQAETLTEQLRQVQKLEALGTLAGGVAHDMNNVLGGIMAVVSLLQVRLGRAHPQAGEMERMLAACRRGRDLTGRLLAYTHRGPTDRQSVSLNGVAVEAIELLRRTLPRAHRIVVDLDPRLPRVQADPSQLNQLLTNLCLNASDALGAGGTIRIATRAVTLDRADLAAHPELEPGPYVRLEVRDDGEGMDEETRSRVFEPFFTTKPPGRGTGLGLWMVYGTARSHRGRVELTSAPGTGTTVTIDLPALVEEAGAGGPMPEAGLVPAPWPATVLLVDDETLLRETLKPSLELLGYRVLTAESGDAALAALETLTVAVDVVVMDLVMPGMDGADLFRHLRARTSGLPVVLISGNADARRVQDLLEKSRVEFLPKPFGLDALSAALARMLKPEP
jgi:PAS domain S-box-containing protein